MISSSYLIVTKVEEETWEMRISSSSLTLVIVSRIPLPYAPTAATLVDVFPCTPSTTRRPQRSATRRRTPRRPRPCCRTTRSTRRQPVDVRHDGRDAR